MATQRDRLRRRIRIVLMVFAIGLLLSGITAFPIPTEIDWLQRVFGQGSRTESWWPWLARWITTVHRGVSHAAEHYDFLFYGTDWLAFGHIVIAIAFIGPLRDPVRNVWVVQFGIIACHNTSALGRVGSQPTPLLDTMLGNWLAIAGCSGHNGRSNGGNPQPAFNGTTE